MRLTDFINYIPQKSNKNVRMQQCNGSVNHANVSFKMMSAAWLRHLNIWHRFDLNLQQILFKQALIIP